MGADIRNRSPADYQAMGLEWYERFPDYAFESGPIAELGELAYFILRSRKGEAPGETSGLMIYRVVDGVIVEGWALPAEHGGRFAF